MLEIEKMPCTKVRAVFLLCLFAVTSCTYFQKNKKNAAKSEAVVEENEETGVQAITDAMRSFNRQLSHKDFDAASASLIRAERGTRNATEVTRSHPDFEDLAVTVERARERYEQAVEADRIARRNAAIDSHIARGQAAMIRGQQIRTAIEKRVPETEDVAALDEVLAQLSELRANGQDYVDEARYVKHAEERDRTYELLSKRRSEADWQVRTTQGVSRPIEIAYVAVTESKKATTSEQKFEAYQRAASAFSDCANTISDLEGSTSYDKTRLVKTRLGQKSLGETKKDCIERASKARAIADNLEWQQKATGLFGRVTQVVQTIRGQKKAAAILEAWTRGLDTLKSCGDEVDELTKHPGHDAAHRFDSNFGKIVLFDLKKVCSAEEKSYEKNLSGLQWRADVEDLIPRLGEIKQQIEAAQKAQNASQKADLWSAASGALDECLERTRALLGQAHADKSYLAATSFGALSVGQLNSRCQTEKSNAAASLLEANRQIQIEQFVSGCRGDEIDVVRREGVPPEIQTYEKGRSFIYRSADKKAVVAKRFDFDRSGKRADFRVMWLDHMSGIVSEINRISEQQKSAKDGESMLHAAEHARPVLDVCIEAAGAAKSDPGYDPAAMFTTAWGKLAAQNLQDACKKERNKLEENKIGIAWRMDFEKMRERVAEAKVQSDKAKNDKTVAEKIENLNRAMGGWRECSERTAAMVKQPGADAKMRVTTVLGDHTAQSLEKACLEQAKLSQQNLDGALAAQKVEDFAKSCRADEAEVVRREGLPTRIEPYANARVFVYEIKGAKGKTNIKRFAFDGKGKRIEEKSITPMPELETPKGAAKKP